MAEKGPVITGPLTDVREHETWWWVSRETPHRMSHGSSRPELLLRAQRIFSGRIEVIRQTVTTVTSVHDVTPKEATR